jgi:hypothetical protein
LSHLKWGARGHYRCPSDAENVRTSVEVRDFGSADEALSTLKEVVGQQCPLDGGGILYDSEAFSYIVPDPPVTTAYFLDANNGSGRIYVRTINPGADNDNITESRINKAMLSGDGYFRIADESL